MQKRLVLLASLMTCALVGITRASSITATFTGVANGGITVTPTLNGAAVGTGLAGQYLWHETAGSPILGNAGDYRTFCIELTQDISSNQSYTYSVVDLATAPRPGQYVGSSGMGTAKADQITQLWGQDFSKVVDGNTAAEFQFAVWRIVYGQIFGVDSGNAARLAVADSWIGALDPNGARAPVIALSSPTVQDQITVAPIPSAAWSGLTLIAGLGTFRFCRRAGRRS